MLKYNYHTHTFLCKHAVGTIKDYLDEAFSNNMLDIAMTDHLPYVDNRLNHSRMDYKDLDNYLNEIDALKENYPNMHILKGFECEYFPDVKDYYFELKKKCDILVLGQHAVFTKDNEIAFLDQLPFDEANEKYYDYIKEALETNLFSLLAHPDLFLLNRDCFDEKAKNFSRKLLNLVRSHDCIIELNANGFNRKVKKGKLGYPNIDFWRLVKEEYNDLRIIINADCHDPKELNGSNVKKCFELAKELNLNLIEHL